MNIAPYDHNEKVNIAYEKISISIAKIEGEIKKYGLNEILDLTYLNQRVAQATRKVQHPDHSGDKEKMIKKTFDANNLITRGKATLRQIEESLSAGKYLKQKGLHNDFDEDIKERKKTGDSLIDAGNKLGKD